MMSRPENIDFLQLLLRASFLLHSHVLIHAASTSPPVTHQQIIYLTAFDPNDYDDDTTDHNSSPPEVLVSMKTTHFHHEPRFCPYDPCLENQTPCARLSERTGCLCPGLSGVDEPPHAPRIQALQPIHEDKDRGKVEVKWCAPSSVVAGYRVVIEGREGETLEVGADLRRSVLGYLEIGTKVCVEAINQAGDSSPSDFSCKRYDPPKPSDHHLLVWIVGGGVILLLLVVLISVILWKCKTCRKGKGTSTDGLGNPSYSRGESL